MDCLCWKTGTTKGGHANRHVWKFDLSIDDSGLGKIEKISYDAYNESTVLVEAVERFRVRTGHYPERLLADQIF